MKYIYKVGLCAMIASVPVIMYNLQSGGPDTSMQRLTGCLNSRSRDTPVELCSVPEWHKLAGEVDDTFADVRQRFSGSQRAQSALDDKHQHYLETRMVRPHAYAAVMEFQNNPNLSADELRARFMHPSAGDMASSAIAIASDINAPEDAMRRHLSFLRSIGAPREEGLAGKWISPYATIYLGDDGAARIEVLQTGPRVEKCFIAARVSITGGEARIEDGPISIFEKALAITSLHGSPHTLRSWTLYARRQSGILVLTEKTPDRSGPDDDAVRPYCDGSAGIAGAYFPAR